MLLWGYFILLRCGRCYAVEVEGMSFFCDIGRYVVLWYLLYVAMLMTVLKEMIKGFGLSNGVLYFATIQYYIFRYTMLCDVVLYYGTLCFAASFFTLEYRGLLGGNISFVFVVILFTFYCHHPQYSFSK